MTLREQVMKHREDYLEQSIRELERLADVHRESSHYLSEESFKLGLKFAIRQIEGAEMLHAKAFKAIPFSNPAEAEREHTNQMNTLAVLKSKLVARYEGKP